MAEQAKVPEIRFAGFTDPWEQRKLGDVTDSFSGGTPDGSHASYYGGSIPFIRSAEINSDKTELFLTEKGLDNSSAKIVERGTVLYALYGATSGEVGIAAIKGAINQAILALSPHTGNDPLFLASWLRREKARIVDTYLQGGQGNLSGSIVKELSFALPQQKEQQVIGSFFSHLDNLITLHQRKYDKLVIFKKTMLEKMFPKDGESVPEIRFAGFTDPWEQRKLGELMDVASVRRVHQEDWTDEGVRFLRARDLVAFAKNESIEDPLFISSEMYKEYSAQSGKVSVGDLLVTGVGTIGVPWLVTSDNPVYFKDGNIIWFKNRHSIDGGFFYHSFTASAIQNCINEAAGIGTVGTYTIETGKKTPIWLPSRQEQREIAAMMTHLDTLITLHQRKLELLQNIKKSLLDKMFV